MDKIKIDKLSVLIEYFDLIDGGNIESEKSFDRTIYPN
jgi:hypothetical protein